MEEETGEGEGDHTIKSWGGVIVVEGLGVGMGMGLGLELELE